MFKKLRMKKKYDEKCFRNIDLKRSFEWLPTNGKLRGSLSGVKAERFEVEMFESVDFFVVANVFDKEAKKILANVYFFGTRRQSIIPNVLAF